MEVGETSAKSPLIQPAENERTSDSNSARAASNAETPFVSNAGAQVSDIQGETDNITNARRDKHPVGTSRRRDTFKNRKNKGRLVGAPVKGGKETTMFSHTKIGKNEN
uniref:Uncharacterized protein n=1 Tax=Plectus sambesii TaxID=2011161 RepID=A0A914VJG9_9BILA